MYFRESGEGTSVGNLPNQNLSKNVLTASSSNGAFPSVFPWDVDPHLMRNQWLSSVGSVHLGCHMGGDFFFWGEWHPSFPFSGIHLFPHWPSGAVCAGRELLLELQVGTG